MKSNVSVYQLIARVTITLMAAGALFVMLSALILEMILPAMGFDPPITSNELKTINESYILPFSFLMEAVALPVIQKDIFFDSVDSYRPLSLQIVCSILIILVIVAFLWLTRYITRRKGAQTATAVALGLVLADTPLCAGHLDWFDLSEPEPFRVITSILLHLGVLALLMLSLRFIRNREDYEDFFVREPYSTIRKKRSEITAAVLTFILCTSSVLLYSFYITMVIGSHFSDLPELLVRILVGLGVFGFATSYGLSFYAYLSSLESFFYVNTILLNTLVLGIVVYMALFFFRNSKRRRPYLIACLTFTSINLLPYFVFPFFPAVLLMILAIIFMALALKEKKIA